jgi:sec-independent protein translocase protein TatA
MSFGPEWFVVLGVIVLLFGAKKLPELARSLGRSSSEFKQGMKEGQAAGEERAPESPAPPPPAQAPAPMQPASPPAPQPPVEQPHDDTSPRA